MSSQEYWKEREAEQKKHNIQEEKEFREQLDEIYQNMMDEIEKQVNGFYVRYARKEGITLSEAKKRVAKLDIESYARKAKKYVKDKEFSDKANAEMRLYNLTMKVNRLELLKAQIGLEMVAGFDEIDKLFDQILYDRTEKELKRQAGILGKTVQNNAKKARVIVNASFRNATFSDRIWMYQDMLKSELAKSLQIGLIQGQNPKKLATHLRKRFGVSQSNAERLMVTELARVQTEAQKQSFEKNGFDEYTFLALGDACPICKGLDEKQFKVSKMMPGANAPPMHPRCRCSTAAYMDDKEYNEWLDGYSEHGMNFEEWNKNGKSVANDSASGIMKLPRYKDAVIPKAKFTQYALNPDKDPNKAKAFEKALGYTMDNADDLIEQINKNLPNYEAVEKGNRGWGMTYEVIMNITGPNGKIAKVLTAWIDDKNSGEMRLTTVHVDD